MPRESRNRVNASPEEFLQDVKPGEHGCVFFFTKEEMQRIHFAFVKSGLDNNWGTVYLTATESTDEVRKSMQKHGINTYQYEEGSGDGSLIILRGEEIYKNPNNPDLDNWINATKSISNMFISKGKKGVRVAADLSAYFISHGLGGQWHKLEYALGKNSRCPCPFFVRMTQALQKHGTQICSNSMIKLIPKQKNSLMPIAL